ncbi:FAD-dependent thymidylate synthase [Candidatus Bathyarchaeota archaeon]|nr:FAD-dependent thymidylate synthase [Candidatus Bathyarchaeota archaeon]
MPKEAARYILPFAQAVGIHQVTMNLRSLQNGMFNFIKNKKLE